MTRYFDAGALIKRYLRETGSRSVRRLLASGTAATSRLSIVEVASGLVRRAREGGFAPEARDQALSALEADFADLMIVELSADLAGTARQLLLRRTLRAGDATQLASALFLQQQVGQPVPFVAFDRRLRKAARLEGLTVAPSR